MTTAARRRVAITGLGALAAPALGAEALWQAIASGASGVAVGPEAGARPLARVAGFDPRAHFDDGALALLDRTSQFALVAAREAVAQALGRPVDRAAAGLAAGRLALAEADIDPARAGAVFAAGLGHTTLEDGYRALFERGASRLHPLTVPRAMPSAPASHLSMAYGLEGPTFAVASACASSAHAIALAAQFIRSGLLDVALTGGAEAALVPGMVRAWEGLRVMSPDVCRPFSRDRNGMVLGEGAAVLVLEDWQHALARGARPLAELVGAGLSADAGDIAAPSARGAARAIAAALADAGLPAGAVDHVNAHGTGTPLNDRTEAAALAEVFGPRSARLPVSSNKPQIGHTLNAAGALEALIEVMALRAGVLPPTLNFREPDPACPLDVVPHVARPASLRVATSHSFAFGGLNAVLVLRTAA